MATRRKYSKEFKLDAISLVEEQGYATTEAVSSFGIRPELIRRWIRERQADDGQAFRGNGKRTPEQEEIKRLKIKMKRLEMEKEIRLVRKNRGLFPALVVPQVCDTGLFQPHDRF